MRWKDLEYYTSIYIFAHSGKLVFSNRIQEGPILEKHFSIIQECDQLKCIAGKHLPKNLEGALIVLQAKQIGPPPPPRKTFKFSFL